MPFATVEETRNVETGKTIIKVIGTTSLSLRARCELIELGSNSCLDHTAVPIIDYFSYLFTHTGVEVELQLQNNLIHTLNAVERTGYSYLRSSKVLTGKERITEYLFHHSLNESAAPTKYEAKLIEQKEAAKVASAKADADLNNAEWEKRAAAATICDHLEGACRTRRGLLFQVPGPQPGIL